MGKVKGPKGVMAVRKHMDTEEIAKRGENIYRKSLKKKLEKHHRGEIVAVDVESGDYFFGKTVIEAVERGRKKYPNRIFHAVRVGYRAVHSVRLR